MKMRKFLSCSLTTLVLVTALAGCSSNSSKSSTSSETSDSGKNTTTVTLKTYLPGDRPADFDKVMAEAEKKMASTVNAKLDVTFVPWSDLSSKTQMVLASGEPVDLMFDAPWNGMQNKINSGSYEPLDELIKKYGQDIMKTTPQAMFDANKFGGKIMGIPLGNAQMAGSTYYVRKDIREKLGIAPIKTYEDLEKFMYAVKDKEKGMIPYLPDITDKSAAAFQSRFDYQTNIKWSSALDTNLALYYKNNDGKVYNLFDTMEPTIIGWMKDARKLYQDGIIDKDVLTIKDHDSEAEKGNVAVVTHADFGVNSDVQGKLKAVNPKYEFEAVTFFKAEKGANISNFQQWNFMCIPKVSKNKEKAMQFLNWVRQSQDNYDLIAYGIKGANYETPKDGEYKPVGNGYGWFPYAWIWNPTQDRVNSSFDENAKTLDKFLLDVNNFTPDKLTGFTFDPKNVVNEIAQFNSIKSKYYDPICNGIVDTDEYMNKFKAEANPIVKKIQAELQSQVDTFLATKK